MEKQERNKKSERQCPNLSPSFGNQHVSPNAYNSYHHTNTIQSSLFTHTHQGRCLWDKGTKPPMPLCPSMVKVNLHAQSSRWPRQLCPRLHPQESRGSLSTRSKFTTLQLGKVRASAALGLKPCFRDTSVLAAHTGSPLSALSEPRLISISPTLCLCPSQKGSQFSLQHSSPKGSE